MINTDQLDIKKILEDIFREILDIPLTEDVTNLTMLGSSKWDSLAQVLIVSAIETHFGLRLSAKDFSQLTSFKAGILILTENIRK